MSNVKWFGYKIRIQFNSTLLVVEQNNDQNTGLYDLDNLPRNLPNNFVLKNCLFGMTDIVKNTNKSKYEYSGQCSI